MRLRKDIVKISLCCTAISIILFSCSTTKYVQDGEFLLDKASIEVDNKSISSFDLETYIKQKPNFKTFEVFKFPLFMYNLSGRDSTKWYNKALKSGGEPPVIFDSTQIDITSTSLSRVLYNKGYLNVKVQPKVILKDKKADIDFKIKTGNVTTINEYVINISDTVFPKNVYYRKYKNPNFKSKNSTKADSLLTFQQILQNRSLLSIGDKFDLDLLDSERERITSLLRQQGFWAFDKEYIGFVADTIDMIDKVNLELVVYPFAERGDNNTVIERAHQQYYVDEVNIYVDYNPIYDGSLADYKPSDIAKRGNYNIFYGKGGKYIKPFVVVNSSYIQPDRLYNEDMTSMTYNAFSQLNIMRNVNIKYEPFLENDTTKLRCIITAIPDKKQAISTELEGTNSAGFLGIGAGIGYTHRNLFRGSEMFNFKVRGSYEAVTPSFTSFMDNYFEIGGEASLTFPRFMFPFINKETRRKLRASTQFSSSYTFQRRPDYFTRTVFSTGIKYLWENRRSRNSISKHTFDLVDVSYIHIPKLDPNFAKTLSESAKIYSFTDQFIVSMGYSYSKTNALSGLYGNNSKLNKNKPTYSFRGSVETAGNALSLIAHLAKQKKEENGSYKFLGTYFAQYFRVNTDYSKTIRIDEKNAIAWRLGGGVVYPYGNSKLVPFEKRFFSGGANSVRGWTIRELGPGAFYRPDANFNDQSADIRFDANIEYRSKAFWKLEFAGFLDAGNIWTIKGTDRQYKGQFKLNTFYKQIASAWGLGIRLDLDFILIRLDCGWKLYDPADIPKYKMDDSGYMVPDGYKSKWRVVHPFKIKQNTAWHIAVGYPF